MLALLVANMALALGPWLVRLAEREAHVGAIGSAFWRLALAFPVLLAACWRSGEPLPVRPFRLLAVAMGGGLFFAADLATWHFGILHTRLANATLLANITAILFPAYGFVAARVWPNRRQVVALCFAAGGAALLLGRSFEISAVNLRGDLLSLLAGLCYTLYLIAVDRVRTGLGPLTTLVAAVAAGLPVLLGATLASGEPIWPSAWAPLVALAVGSQLVGQGLVLFAIGRVPPLAIGLMLLVQPFVSALIGWADYGEHLGMADALGALAIAAAILLIRVPPQRLRADVKALDS